MFIVEHIAGHRRRSFFPITDCGITHWKHLGVRPICGGERARVAGDGHEKSLYHPRLRSLDCCAWVRVRHWHYSHTPLSFLAGAFPFDSGLACLTPLPPPRLFRRERAASPPRTDEHPSLIARIIQRLGHMSAFGGNADIYGFYPHLCVKRSIGPNVCFG